MLLPRGKTEKGQPEVGPGFYPPLMHQISVPKDPEQWAVESSYSIVHNVEAMAKIKGIGRGKKHNLMAQVIPIYGFGILLYILYIIYKLTCKGKTNTSGGYTTINTAHMENTITTDYELARLQERLLQTERLMDRIVSGKGSGSGRRRRRSKTASKKEEKLLRQLRQLTQLIQEGRLEGASPEMEAEEVPYGADWEGYPEETYPEYDESFNRCKIETIRLEVPSNQPTAEALAERMLQEEEELMARKLSIVQEEDEEEEGKEEEEEDKEEDDDEEEEEEEEVEEIEEDMEEIAEDIVVEDEEEEEEEDVAERRQLLSPRPSRLTERKQERIGLEVLKELQSHNGGKKQISFSDHKDVFHYPKEGTYEEDEEEVEEGEEENEVEEEDEGTEVEEEGDEEDPVMEAESLQFSVEGCPNPEEDKEEYSLTPAEGEAHISADMPKEVSGLRMRNRRET